MANLQQAKNKVLLHIAGLMKIQVSNGDEFFFIDERDHEKVAPYCWFMDNEGYIRAWVDKKKTTLHHHVYVKPEGNFDCIDHANGNRWDNRKSNLRLTNKLHNNQNQKIRSDNTSGYKGVYFFKNTRKGRARVKHEGENVSLGYFNTAIEAARAYNEGAKKYHGEFAVLNKV